MIDWFFWGWAIFWYTISGLIVMVMANADLKAHGHMGIEWLSHLEIVLNKITFTGSERRMLSHIYSLLDDEKSAVKWSGKR